MPEPAVRDNHSRSQLLRSLLMFAAALFAAADVHGQLPTGRLDTVFPAGGQRGTTFTTTIVSAADLDETKTMWFSHPGIRAVPTSDGIEGSSSFHISIDSSVPTGLYEVRAGGLFGLSNPRLFRVGDMPESAESEPNDTREQPTAIAINATINAQMQAKGDIDWFRFQGDPDQRVLIECAALELDSALHCRLEVYDETGKRIARGRGNKFSDALVDVTLNSSGPYFVRVADQTFQGSNEHVYRLTVHTRPHIDFIMPSAVLPGTRQTITVFGRNLPGGSDEGKTADGKQLQSVTAEVIAPRLPDDLRTPMPVRAQAANVDGFAWGLPDSNAVLIKFATTRPATEVEPNDSQSQLVVVPADISGQFQQKQDVDSYSFDAKKNDVYYIEALGQREGSAADPYFVLESVKVDDKGVEKTSRITAQDDNSNNVGGNDFPTANGDPTFRFTAPSDGRFRVSIRDRYSDSRGDVGLTYRLTIRKPDPDFRLVALAGKVAGAENQPLARGSVAVRRGGNYEISVLALRRDGFAEPIRVFAENLPAGVSCQPAWLSAKSSRTTLVFKAETNAVVGHHEICVRGEATILNAPLIAAVNTAEKARVTVPASDQKALAAADKNLERAIEAEFSGRRSLSHFARPATIIRNRTGAASETRLAESLLLSVLPDASAMQVSSSTYEVHANQSQQLLIPLDVAKRHGFDDNVNITFTGQPTNVDVEARAIAKGAKADAFRLFLKNNVEPGTYTLFARAKASVPFRRNPWKLEREQAAHANFVAKVAETTKSVTTAKASEASSKTEITSLQKQMMDAQQGMKMLSQKIAAGEKAIAAAATDEKTTRLSIPEIERMAAARKAVVAAVSGSAELASQKAVAQALVAAADKNLAKARERLKSVIAAKAAALKQLQADTASHVKKTNELKAFPAKIANSKQRLEVAVAGVKLAEERLKKANAEKAEADKRLKAVQNQTKVVKVNVYQPSTPIVLHIAKSPLAVAAVVPNGGNVKRGAALDIAVKLTRTGYAGPVKLSLFHPSTVGLAAPHVELAAGVNDAIVKLTAAPDAKPGGIPHAVVRAEFTHAGRNFSVDAPVTLQVQQ